MAQKDFDEPKNTTGMEFFEIESYTVASWGPNPDGKPPQNQVHFLLTIMDAASRQLPPFVMRFHSRRAVNELVDLLARYRDEVWKEDGKLTKLAETGED